MILTLTPGEDNNNNNSDNNNNNNNNEGDSAYGGSSIVSPNDAILPGHIIDAATFEPAFNPICTHCHKRPLINKQEREAKLCIQCIGLRDIIKEKWKRGESTEGFT